jgi:uncharacterized protein (DUF1330 family)
MTAYVVINNDVLDPERYAEYAKLAPATIEAYGGKYLARGGKVEVLEGDWVPARLVILQFESVEQAKKWINSPEYSEPRKMRQSASHSRIVVIEGV